MDKDQQHVKLGFRVFLRFHEMNYVGRKQRTYEDFIRSQFYSAFTKFGRYLLNINAVNPNAFIDFLIKTGVKIDKWESPLVYETYIRELNKKETPDAAVERNILLMQQWAMSTGESWVDFFRKVSPSQATLWIQSGRISPWVLFTASSASELFTRMSDEQLELVQKHVDPDFWSIKLKRNKEDVDSIRAILDEAGL